LEAVFDGNLKIGCARINWEIIGELMNVLEVGCWLLLELIN
jgi:hypothetical protein